MVIYLLILKLRLVYIDLRKAVGEWSLDPGELKGAVATSHVSLIGSHLGATVKSWSNHTLLVHVENFHFFVKILLWNRLLTVHYLFDFILKLFLELEH